MRKKLKMQLLNEKCREVSGHGAERSHYQPNRVRNSVVKNEFAKPGLSWQKGSLVMKSLLMLFGYSAYHAECVAPMMWAFVICAIAIGVAEWKGWLS